MLAEPGFNEGAARSGLASGVEELGSLQHLRLRKVLGELLGAQVHSESLRTCSSFAIVVLSVVKVYIGFRHVFVAYSEAKSLQMAVLFRRCWDSELSSSAEGKIRVQGVCDSQKRGPRHVKLEFKTLTSSASSSSKLKSGTVHDRGWTKNLQLVGWGSRRG